MTYTKPELVALTHAVEAIQSGTKMGWPADAEEPPNNLTSGAYEADE